MTTPDNTPISTTRDRIVDAAATVLRELGLARATTKEIAREAGYSEATLYKHFSDKTEIFLAVLTERLPDLPGTITRITRTAQARTLRANLTLVARAAIDFYSESFPIAVSLFSAPDLLRAHRSRLTELNAGPHQVVHGLAHYLDDEQRNGRIGSDVDTAVAAELLIGACFHRAFLTEFTGVPLQEPARDDRAAAVADHVAGSLEPVER